MYDPDYLVRRFAMRLGWRGIERTDIVLTPEICGDLLPGTVVTCYSTNCLKHFIQINQLRVGSFGAYKVSVVAERYNIGPMGFQTCEFATIGAAIQEADRLFPMFGRSNFRNARWRRSFLERHPEKLLRVRKKWRGWKARVRSSITPTRHLKRN